MNFRNRTEGTLDWLRWLTGYGISLAQQCATTFCRMHYTDFEGASRKMAPSLSCDFHNREYKKKNPRLSQSFVRDSWSCAYVLEYVLISVDWILSLFLRKQINCRCARAIRCSRNATATWCRVSRILISPARYAAPLASFVLLRFIFLSYSDKSTKILFLSRNCASDKRRKFARRNLKHVSSFIVSRMKMILHVTVSCKSWIFIN